MAYGVTFGGALALQLGRALPNSTVSQDAITGVFMPYLVMSPAYWGSSIGDLCAAHLSAPGEVVEKLRERRKVTESTASACFWHKVGLFVGRPFSYETTTTLKRSQPAQRMREVKPLVSTGVVFSPSSLYSAGVGLSFGDVERDDRSTVMTVVPTLWLGVNADALGLLF